MNEDIVEHKVEIDDSISATLKIPKVLTAIDLKALMHKANKLFNLAEVNIQDRKQDKKPREFQKRKDIEEIKEIVSNWDDANSEGRKQMAVDMNKSLHSLTRTIYYWKKKFNIGIEPNIRTNGRPKSKPVEQKGDRKYRKRITWTKEQVTEFKKMVGDKVPQDKMAEHFGVNLKQVWDMKYRLKQRGELQDED